MNSFAFPFLRAAPRGTDPSSLSVKNSQIQTSYCPGTELRRQVSLLRICHSSIREGTASFQMEESFTAEVRSGQSAGGEWRRVPAPGGRTRQACQKYCADGF